MLAGVTSDSQQPLVQIGTTARDLTEEEECIDILRQTDSAVVNVFFNVTHLSFPDNNFRFSLPRFPPNTKSGKFNPLHYLQIVYLS